MKEEGMLKIYYVYELFLYNYSRQTESKLFYKMYLKWVCTFGLLKHMHLLESSQHPAIVSVMQFVF
jgi:hypothetical protein